jgi:L-aminopeptidase/D-esterase-like protein
VDEALLRRDATGKDARRGGIGSQSRDMHQNDSWTAVVRVDDVHEVQRRLVVGVDADQVDRLAGKERGEATKESAGAATFIRVVVESHMR